MTATLTRTVDDGVLTLVLNRPGKRNALDAVLAESLSQAFTDAAEGSPDIRAVLLTGEGPAFCAGDDLAATARWQNRDYTGTPNHPDTREHLYLTLCRQMLELPLPVVVAVNGPALGAGLSLVCAADYRVAARHATFASPALDHGHIGDAALLTRTVGPARATHLYLSGERLSAERAAAYGLVDHVVADDQLHRTATTAAARLADRSTQAIAMFKSLRERVWHTPTDTAIVFQDRSHHLSHRHRYETDQARQTTGDRV
ncbi:enoyl-CoA hydratase/isomerase family protein [Streptomyces cyaneofuscatus]|uniref:enoyl-CoA hydratase/isomerase family protein n=1 Tax=Streptomyces cyaneofuscatus TaxID=66883 RepID=UPI00366467DE